MGYRVRFESVLVFCLSLLLTLGTGAVAASTPQAISGDFNGDGRLDALMQPADDTGQTSIILSDSTGQLTIPGQTWNSGYLGLNWGQSNSVIHVGDLTGNGRDDVLVQSLTTGGPSAVLLSDANGQFAAINQSIPTPYLGMDWSEASHQILAGKFGGGLQSEVLLQTAIPGGQNMIVQPNLQGMLLTTAQTWADGYLGLNWDAQDVTLYVGDFTGNGQDGLLMQQQSSASASNPEPYTLLLPDAQGQFTQVNQTWGLNAFGANWSPSTETLKIEDVNGDGIADIVLESKVAGGTNYLIIGNDTGHFSGTAISWQGDMTPQQALQQYWQKNSPAAGTSTATVTQSVQQSATLATNLVTPNTIGTLNGQSGVDGGAATYSVPIAVPPGRAGMQPSLSLSYSSRGGNGDLGVGWSLGGLSAITRCPATKAQDGFTQGVTYSSTYDRLCLDGQHLIVVSGTYGQSGSVYRTELDSLVRVTLTGGINSATSEFEVDYENGNKSFYGYNSNGQTSNAVFVASGETAPLVWAIGQEQDGAENNVVYNYTSYGSGEYHISSITYTGTSSGNNVSTQGNRQVTFTYQTRSDPSSVYLAGGLTRQTHLLTSITTYAAGTEVQKYALNYAPSNATNRNLLQSIQECAYNGESQTCFPATTFAWQEPALSFGSPTALSLPGEVGTESGGDSTTVGVQTYITLDKDFDGDGQNELRYVNPEGGYDGIIWVGNQNNYVDLTQLFPGVAVYADEDFLSNGLADPIGPVGSTGNYDVGVATCTTQIVCTNTSDFTVTATAVPYTYGSIATGQFSGRGMPDIVAEENIRGFKFQVQQLVKSWSGRIPHTVS